MSTSKHIDRICIAITILALLLTGLFMNGRALGIEPIADADAGDGQFTANDLAGSWDRSGATQITLTGRVGSVKGNGAYIYDGDVHIVYAGRYVLSGELWDGSVIIDADGDDKIWLLLDGVSLRCEDSAAILVEQADKVFLTLADGTTNTVSCGAVYSEDALSSGIDGAIYSRDDLTVNGGGFLAVTAGYKHGMVCNDDLVITGGTIDITAAQDGIHANDSVRITEADITINAGDDGITVSNDEGTAYVYIASGSITIPSCYEGIEAMDITIAGGRIDIRPTDDGINANGGKSPVLRVTGGDLTIINETGRDADGLDSNGSIYISGGNIFISVNGNGGSCALDCGSENGGVCEISGGTVIAAGGSSMAEGFDSSSTQCFIMYNTSTAAAGTVVTLKNAQGTVLVSEAIPCVFSSVVISTPELQMGETCTLLIGDTQTQLTVDNSSNSSGFGMGGMFGGGMHGGGMHGGGMGQDGTFGGRGGKTGWPADGQTGTGSTGTGDAPEMPGGEFGRGGRMDHSVNGQTQGTPEMPEGGTMPEGQMPQGTEDPTETDTQQSVQDRWQGMGSRDRFNGDQTDRTLQRGQELNRTQGSVAAETSAVSANTLIPMGILALVLLAGLLVAFKVKH